MTTVAPSPNLQLVLAGNCKLYKRACARCGVIRTVNRPNAKKNLCRDCVSVLTQPERARWAA